MKSFSFYFLQLEDCMVCSEVQAEILFKPCNHMVACGNCAKIMKKCVECRTPIDQKVPFKVCCGGKIGKNPDRPPISLRARRPKLRALSFFSISVL